MASKAYRIFGTTADVGVVSRGTGLIPAFEGQAAGMIAVMTDMRRVRATEGFTVEAEGPDLPGLLVSWLEELHFLFDTKGVLLKEFRITRLTGLRLKATVRGEAIDPNRHVMKTPIKAVTYHMLEVKETGEGVTTRVVYDI